MRNLFFMFDVAFKKLRGYIYVTRMKHVINGHSMKQTFLITRSKTTMFDFLKGDHAISGHSN